MWVSVYDMGWPEELGLLGQDFLRNFNVNINPARGQVTIAPK